MRPQATRDCRRENIVRPPLWLDVDMPRGSTTATVRLSACRNCGKVKVLSDPCGFDHLAALMEFQRRLPVVVSFEPLNPVTPTSTAARPCPNCGETVTLEQSHACMVDTLNPSTTREEPMDEKSVGVIKKYDVRRVNDPEGKHAECRYFVLDPRHDPLARDALVVYAHAAEVSGYGSLAEDLRGWLDELPDRPGGLDQVLLQANTLEELVFQALGAASVCWETPEGAGVFDSTRAKAVGDELVARIREREAEPRLRANDRLAPGESCGCFCST